MKPFLLYVASIAVLLVPLEAPSSTYETSESVSIEHQQQRSSNRSNAARRPARRAPRPPVRPPLAFTEPRGESALQADLNHMIATHTRSGEWGVMVVSLTKGDTLFSRAADTPLMPASTMKLFTAAVALERLGPDHTFRTDVLRDGVVTDEGVLKGNLVLRGDGDPAFSSRFLRGGPDAPMSLLAQLIAGAGIRRIEGDLIADASVFESRRIPEGWLSRYQGAAYAAPFSALSLNENIVVVAVTPNRVGQGATVKLEPETHGVSITNTVRTVAGKASRISSRSTGDDKVLVSGTIGAAAGTMRYQLVVGDPVTFTAGAFRAALDAAGIEVNGVVRAGRTPENAAVVAGVPSPSLARIVSVMNRESINHYAELVWRNAARGADRSGFGSAEAAWATLDEFLLSSVGVTPGAVVATDGSGLSVLDRVTPRALVQLLAHAHVAPWSAVFHASLPVAGESELLRTRMRSTPAAGNLHAKTGTTNDIISLAGYVTAENGEILAFSLIYNGTDRWNAREVIDAVGPTLAAFSRD